MEQDAIQLMYPAIPVAAALLLAGGLFALHMFRNRREQAFAGGIRAGGSERVKALPLYAKLARRRRILAILLEAFLSLSVLSASFLLARPHRTERTVTGVQKRDIFLCMDVSYSIYELNHALTDYLKTIVRELEGDRFGVCIFNTSTVVYVPMTDDYDYVIQRLEELEEYFVLQKEYMDIVDGRSYVYEIPEEDLDRYYELDALTDYYDAGTLLNNLSRGSSLIGEGLATCLYSFPSIGDKERTRVIILSTDNADSSLGDERPMLPEAARLCAKNDVTVFGIFPDISEFDLSDYTEEDYEAFREELETSVRKTGGAFYWESKEQTVSDIVRSIRSHPAMAVDEIVQERTVDHPFLPFLFLFLGMAGAGAAAVCLRL